jgi:hypothetical protein
MHSLQELMVQVNKQILLREVRQGNIVLTQLVEA